MKKTYVSPGKAGRFIICNYGIINMIFRNRNFLKFCVLEKTVYTWLWQRR